MTEEGNIEFKELDDEQKDAVTRTGSPLLVRAEPGSGKTFVMIDR